MKFSTLAFGAGIFLSVFISLSETVFGQAVEAWAQRYSNPVDSNEQAQKIATDAGDNVIVAGYTDEGISGQDILVIKYSNAGAAVWTNRYDGPANGDDQPVGIAVDKNSGKVLVTGYSRGISSGVADWVTIAYSSSGVPLWTNRYNGPGNNTDKPFALAVDTNGNVFVTGYAATSASAADYATIKYSGAGMPLWTNRYSVAGNGANESHALALDAAGDVIVTGVTGNGTALDIATVEYSNMGVPLWTNRFNGPANGDDRGNAVAVDTNGNVFITGISTGSGSSYDYVTIKYSGGGGPLWTNRYNGPGNSDDQATAVAVDTNGDVVVSGFSPGTGPYYDFATVKYSGTGVPLWTNRYDGPAFYDDRVNAMAMDINGNVLVTGFSYSYGSSYDYTTIKYSGAGVALWTNRYDGPLSGSDQANAIAVDGNGNVFVTGFSPGSSGSSDWATVKYESGGGTSWTARYNGVANRDDQPQATAVDGNGNVFVTGFSYNSAGSAEWATLGYSSAGVTLWTNRFTGPGAGGAQANAVVTDTNGNVFVAGYSTGSGANPDFVTIKYSGAGVPLWTNRYNGSGNNSDFCNAMAIDPFGDVIITGTSIGSGGNFDYATVKYSNDGIPLWTNRYNGTGNSTDDPKAIAVDVNGNVFVTGNSTGPGTSYDFGTVAYSRTGVPLWTNRYDGISFDDTAASVTADTDGNAIVTGSSLQFSVGLDVITIKYSLAGTPVWTNRYTGFSSSSDSGQDVVVNKIGTVFVTGSTVPGAGYDYLTIAYSSLGSPLWTNIFNGPPANSNDQGYSAKLDGNGDLYVGGYSVGIGTLQDFCVIKYTEAGLTLMTNRYNSPANSDDALTTKACMAISSDGSVYLAGATRPSTTGTVHDYLIVKYQGSIMPLGKLEIQELGNQAVLTWSGGNFSLQSAPAVTGSYSNILGASSPYTNPITGSQMFFRLKAN